MKVHPELHANGAQTRKDIVCLSPGIWTAVGYAASNVHMIEGSATTTIIGASESTRAASKIREEFRKLTDKPVGRIVCTHSHRDHISGAAIFSGESVPIFASHLFQSDLIDVDETAIAANRAPGRRTRARFGIGLTSRERVSPGCGPGDRPKEGPGAGIVKPGRLVEADCIVDLDGVSARLILAPGETADHMVVWLPEQRILFCGDNCHHAFPNLYAIRGTPYRDYGAWAKSLARLADLRPEVLSPGHARPVFGESRIQDFLSTTRDAILHVMKTGADGLDAGLPLDDIVATEALPKGLADKPRLKEFPGKFSWSIRAFAEGTLGWYDRNPTHLGTLASLERAAPRTWRNWREARKH
ncbi:MAG: MBL fold metallo-hydrolase [Rhodobacteraceae bacterium]|nr:MBL fold metallo-hydrolase [Paracoccaceae bacterium]